MVSYIIYHREMFQYIISGGLIVGDIILGWGSNRKQERLKSNNKLRVCVVKNMCGWVIFWHFFDRLTDNHTDKKVPKDRLRAYPNFFLLYVEIPLFKGAIKATYIWILHHSIFPSHFSSRRDSVENVWQF